MRPLAELVGRRVHLVGVSSLELADVACFLGRRGGSELVGHDLAAPDQLFEHFRAAHIGMMPAERQTHWDALQAVGLELRLGADYLRGLAEADVVIASQAWRLYEANAPLAALVEARAAALWTPIEVYLALAAERGVPSVGVTGSNGKSTTANLVAHLLRASGASVVLAGNYRYRGPILEDLEALDASGRLVLEVSNHHLLALRDPVDVAVITNVTPNHLEEHGGFEAYTAVKRRLAENQTAAGLLVLNDDDPVSRAFESVARGRVQRFSLTSDASDAGVEEGWVVLRDPQRGTRTPLLPVGELPLVGAHNVQNVLAASLAACASGAVSEGLGAALTRFETPPGRLEPVREAGGVQLVYDIESTTPESTRRGLEAFPVGRVHLLAGGDNKGLDYQLFAEAVRDRGARLYLLEGSASDAIRVASRHEGVVPREHPTLAAALDDAWSRAVVGDVILLSPGARGFYNRYLRGQDSFARLAKRLSAARRGEALGGDLTVRDARRLEERLRAVLPESLVGRAGELAALLAARSRPTPLEWHEELGCFLKRDDLDVSTTHKSRGIGLQLALAAGEGTRGVVISSSGNAAVAAGAWCAVLGLRCLAFLSDETEAGKVEAVRATGALVVATPKPKNFSRYAARYAGLVDLRPSLDPHGSLGYRTLAAELTGQLGSPPTSLFLFVNSGLTLLGVWEGFQRLLEQGVVAFVPQLHAVQCTASPALAEALHTEPELERSPVAGALGAQEPAHLRETAAAIARSGGRLWMVTNDAVLDEQQQLARHGLGMAIESVATMAGLRKARRHHEAALLGAHVVALVAAPERASVRAERDEAAVARPQTYADVRELLDGLGLGRSDVD